MNSTPKILVVDDEPDVLTLLEALLRREGFVVLTAATGSAALEAIEHRGPDLIVLDLMLPGFSGFEILRRAKSNPTRSDPRVILLTARVEEVDRIRGFELGADDYVSKPFSPRELLLRIKALLRRDQDQFPDATPRTVGPFEIDIQDYRVSVDGQPVDLTVTEFKLLVDLVRANGRVRTREALLAELWAYDSSVMSRTIDTHVRRLRRKLGPAAAWLTTVRGVGYRFLDPDPSRRV